MLGLEPMAESEDLQVSSDVDSGGGGYQQCAEQWVERYRVAAWLRRCGSFQHGRQRHTIGDATPPVTWMSLPRT